MCAYLELNHIQGTQNDDDLLRECVHPQGGG